MKSKIKLTRYLFFKLFDILEFPIRFHNCIILKSIFMKKQVYQLFSSNLKVTTKIERLESSDTVNIYLSISNNQKSKKK